MDKKTMTAAELAAQKELEAKKAADREAKKAARKEAIKKRMSLLEKADPKTVTAETKSVLEMMEENISEAISEAFDEMDLSDTVERLEEITECLDKIDTALEDADLKNFKAGINEKLLRVRSELESIKGGASRSNGKKSIADMVEDVADDIKSLQVQQSGGVKIDVKMGRKDAPDFIGRSPNTNFAGVEHEPNILNNTVLPGVVAIIHPTSHVLEHVRTQTITNPSIFVVNEVVGEEGGDFEWTEEGALKPYVDFGFEVESVTARKIAAFSKTSREMLADVPFMQAETTRIITGKYERKLANEVLRGVGGNDSIFGVLHYASDYTQLCLNGKVVKPGLSEVLFATATQIRNMGFEGMLTAFVNPCDWAAEMMRKKDDGELLKMNELLEGITLVPTGEMSPDEYFIGDMSVYTLYVYENFAISYGYENDDFRRNLISLVAESRMYGFVPMNHYGALVADSVANVAGLIAK